MLLILVFGPISATLASTSAFLLGVFLKEVVDFYESIFTRQELATEKQQLTEAQDDLSLRKNHFMIFIEVML